jgi:hypothetical protein
MEEGRTVEVVLVLSPERAPEPPPDRESPTTDTAPSEVSDQIAEPPAATESRAHTEPTTTTETPRGSVSISGGAVATVATGAVALGLGLVFLLLRNEATGALDRVCTQDTQSNRSYCPDNADTQNWRNQAGLFNTLSNVSTGTGLVLIAGGAVWFTVSLLTSERTQSTARRSPVRVVGSVLPSGHWLGIQGMF